MAARRPPANNNHLEEAMALLIGNQAAFVEQIARSDRERTALQRKSDELARKSDERFARVERRFIRVEERLSRIETILLRLPKAIKKEIGFKSPT